MYSAVPDNAKTLAEFSSELIVEGCVRCLKLINAEVDLPLKLPESMSVRFRIGTALAQACKVLSTSICTPVKVARCRCPLLLWLLGDGVLNAIPVVD